MFEAGRLRNVPCLRTDARWRRCRYILLVNVGDILVVCCESSTTCVLFNTNKVKCVLYCKWVSCYRLLSPMKLHGTSQPSSRPTVDTSKKAESTSIRIHLCGISRLLHFVYILFVSIVTIVWGGRTARLFEFTLSVRHRSRENNLGHQPPPTWRRVICSEARVARVYSDHLWCRLWTRLSSVEMSRNCRGGYFA